MAVTWKASDAQTQGPPDTSSREGPTAVTLSALVPLVHNSVA